jgi:hypothetical protein
MVYGLVHNDSIAPVVADIIENARAVYKFRALLIAIVSQFSGIDLTANVQELDNKSFWSLVNDVREQRNAILHRDQLLKVSKEDAEKAISGAAQPSRKRFARRLENHWATPSWLNRLLRSSRCCADAVIMDSC